MDTSRGHCNGTCYIIRQVSLRCITAEIACGEYSGNILFIPRTPLTLSPTDAGLPFTQRLCQFPIRPAFAMTINKVQGQTLQRSGVLLDETVFTHGQLYVASSHCGDPSNIRFFVQNGQTANVVYTEVLSCWHSSMCVGCTAHFCRILYKGVLSMNCQWQPYLMYKDRDCMTIMWIIRHFCTFGLSNSR